MKPFRKVLPWCVIALTGLAFEAPAADVVNGWSGETTIAFMRSDSTVTWIRLNNMTTGCGDSEYWMMQMDSTDAGRFRRAILLTALAAGKALNLRCENSTVTDLVVVR